MKQERYTYLEKLKWKEKIALGVFVLSVFSVIVLGVSSISKSNPTGAVIGAGGEAGVTQTGVSICSDSDEGKEYSLKGSVNYCDADGNCLKKIDSCSDSVLTEYYCKNNEYFYENHECSDYCDEGACLSVASDYKYRVGRGGSGGSGGGPVDGGSSVASPAIGETYDLGELNSENTLEISKTDQIIFDLNGVEYTLYLQDFSQTEATIIGAGSDTGFVVNEDNRLDLNNDGTSDFYLKVRRISTASGKVKLTFNLV